MKRLVSLIKATMTDGMSLFKIKNKKKNTILLPLFLFGIIFLYMWSYANVLMEPLDKIGMEYVGLTMFIAFTIIFTFIEGIYKSGSLLFNCKDDDLLLSLPIKRGTVIFIRLFKFYVFELLFNSMFLAPAMIAYIRWVDVGPMYYLISILGLLFIPMIPVAISSIFGFFIYFFSSKFKKKSLVQIIVSIVFMIGVMYLSFNMNGLLSKIALNAASIHDLISKIYYPAGLYIGLILDFNIINLLIFISINIFVFTLIVLLFSKVYFKINTNVKAVSVNSLKKNYIIKVHKPIVALIKKELNRFSTSPVFVINAAFGLVLYVIGCVLVVFKFDSIVDFFSKNLNFSLELEKSFIPLGLFGFIVFSSLMSSITSSMISLEGKTFNILKSLPIEPYKIVQTKVYTAVLIVIPCILFGDLVIFFNFKFNIIEILLILITSFILPLVAETIGITINLKYPKMDASNDTEVVKQSMSSMIAVFLGMVLIGLTAWGIYKLLMVKLSIDLIITLILAVYIVLYIMLYLYLKKTSEKRFNEIIV